jgi:3-hydroxyacyl-[acyl-carrier-protein] dehydratase
MAQWYSMTDPEHLNQNEITCKAGVELESPWFSGHFPDDPILPGIAQLAIVFDAIKKMHKNDKKISEIRRVRFKQVIRPDDIMDMIITSHAEGPSRYSFRIMIKGELACSGTMIMERSE